MKEANKIVNMMLNFQLQMKVLHWQTASYVQHMAFGGIYDYLDGAIDKFVEIYQGKYTRIKFQPSASSLKLVDTENTNINGIIREFGSFLISLSGQLKPKEDSDLLNLRDEILGEINKLKYLLTLK